MDGENSTLSLVFTDFVGNRAPLGGSLYLGDGMFGQRTLQDVRFDVSAALPGTTGAALTTGYTTLIPVDQVPPQVLVQLNMVEIDIGAGGLGSLIDLNGQSNPLQSAHVGLANVTVTPPPQAGQPDILSSPNGGADLPAAQPASCSWNAELTCTSP